MSVTVVAQFTLQEGRSDVALEVLEELLRATHDEAGCLTYALHRDASDPHKLTIIERWTSQVALDNHMVQPHIATMGKRAPEFLAAAPVVSILEPVPLGDPVKGAL